MIEGRKRSSAMPSGPSPASRKTASSRSMNSATRSASRPTSGDRIAELGVEVMKQPGDLGRVGDLRPADVWVGHRRYRLCMSIGPLEVVIILLILLLIFGGRRIPELGRALGSGFRNLREHVGGRPKVSGEIDSGEEASRPSSAEPVEDEEAAKRP